MRIVRLRNSHRSKSASEVARRLHCPIERERIPLVMKIEADPMEQPILQQPIRKIIGRPHDPRQVLTRLYDLQIFARNITCGL